MVAVMKKGDTRCGPAESNLLCSRSIDFKSADAAAYVDPDLFSIFCRRVQTRLSYGKL